MCLFKFSLGWPTRSHSMGLKVFLPAFMQSRRALKIVGLISNVSLGIILKRILRVVEAVNEVQAALLYQAGYEVVLGH
jgi:hypothetical protein